LRPFAFRFGTFVSVVAHVALLLVTLVSFSVAPKIRPAEETIVVDLVSDTDDNEIMKGEKDAKQAAPTPLKADKVAEVEEKKPTPIREAKTDVVAPPPQLRRIPDPGESQQPELPTPTPPQRVAALPPEPPKPEPEPVKPEPPRPPARPPEPAKVEAPPPKPDAEPVEPPKPPQRPKEEPTKAEVAPTPPTPPKPPVRPKAEEKPLDPAAISKLLKETEPQKPAARPKSGDETAVKTKYDSNAMSDLLSREAPSQKASTARSASQQASLGAPTASAARMSPSLMGQLDGLMQDRYKQCWTYVGMAATRYIPQIKVEFAVNGALIGEPMLLNPPGDPNLRTLAESALRAVRRCDPMPIPAQFAPYHQEWKSRILRFDPEEMAG
jgi:colicin import membrane protein